MKLLFTLRQAKRLSDATKTQRRACFFASPLFIPRYKPQKPAITMGYWPFYPGFYTVFSAISCEVRVCADDRIMTNAPLPKSGQGFACSAKVLGITPHPAWWRILSPQLPQWRSTRLQKKSSKCAQCLIKIDLSSNP